MARAVLYVAGKDPLWEAGGGHSSYVRAHCRAARRAGFEPHVFCTSGEGGLVETDYGLVHRVASPAVRWLGLRNRGAPLDVRLLAAAVTRHGRAHPGPHLVHGFAFWGSAGVLAARRLGAAGVEAVPIVSLYTTVAHESAGVVQGLAPGHGPGYRARRRLDHLYLRLALGHHERRACRGSRLALVNYAAVHRLLARQCPDLAPVRRIGYASEMAFLREDGGRPAPRTPRPGAPLIVSLSRHDARKGVDRLVRALGRLRATGVAFRARLAGSGPLLEPHRALVRRLGLSSAVSVDGFVPDAFGLLEEADVFVLPSVEEGGGSVALLEAFQAGVAVVASACDGIPEDVTDGENGLLVRPPDVEPLARALARVVTDPALRARLGRGARDTFQRRFTAAAFARDLGALYRELGFAP